MAVIYVAGGTLSVRQSIKWFVWWPGPTLYTGPIIFQASPLDPDAELELTSHTVLRTSSNPPPGLPSNSIVHSVAVTNRGSVPTSYYLWSLRE